MTGRHSLHHCYDVSYRCWFASEEAEIYCYNFNFFIEECCVVIEKNIDRKLANRISYRIWYKRCLKGKFGSRGGSKSAMWGPYPPWHRISLILHMYGVVNDLATNHHTGQFDGHCVFFKSLKTHGLIQSKTLISVRLSRTYRLASCNASVTAMGISKKFKRLTMSN